MENYQSTDWLVITAGVSNSLLLSTSQTQMALYSELVSGNLRLATNEK
jgi:hypothetical protein